MHRRSIEAASNSSRREATLESHLLGVSLHTGMSSRQSRSLRERGCEDGLVPYRTEMRNSYGTRFSSLVHIGLTVSRSAASGANITFREAVTDTRRLWAASWCYAVLPLV